MLGHPEPLNNLFDCIVELQTLQSLSTSANEQVFEWESVAKVTLQRQNGTKSEEKTVFKRGATTPRAGKLSNSIYC